MQEVREKRGLAYSVYTYLYPLDHAGIFVGGVATENKAVGQSMDLIKAELKRVAEEGLSEQELRTAKDYLIGSFALRFDTSAKIARQFSRSSWTISASTISTGAIARSRLSRPETSSASPSA